MANKSQHTLTTAAVARATGVSESTVRNLANAGTLHPLRSTDGRRLFTQNDIAAVREHVERRREELFGGRNS